MWPQRRRTRNARSRPVISKQPGIRQPEQDIMRTIPRGALLAVVLMSAGPAVVTSSLAMAAEPAVYAGFPSGLAVDGYDPVAYFVEGRPVAGYPAFQQIGRASCRERVCPEG